MPGIKGDTTTDARGKWKEDITDNIRPKFFKFRQDGEFIKKYNLSKSDSWNNTSEEYYNH